jgi:hypothetical protein
MNNSYDEHRFGEECKDGNLLFHNLNEWNPAWETGGTARSIPGRN